VALGKILNLGGIDNKPPKTDQSMGRFRVARNVMPTPDSTLIPRYDNSEPSGQPSNVICTHHIAEYDGEAISVVTQDSGIGPLLKMYKNNQAIPQNFVMPDSPYVSNTMDYPQSVQSYRVNNTVYFLSPLGGNLLKYDGVEVSKAGCDQPKLGIASADFGGSKWLRVVQHVLDFDKNEPVSEYLEFPVGISGNTIDITLSGSASSGYQMLPGAYPDTKPSESLIPSIGTDNYFVGTAIYDTSPANSHFVITSTDNNIAGFTEKIGSYVIVACDQNEMLTMGFDTSLRYFGLALKVKSVSPLRLDSKDVYIYNSLKEWEKVDLSLEPGTCTEIASVITYGSRKFLSFWSSAEQQGIYYFRKLVPCFPESNSLLVTGKYKTTIDVSNPNLADLGYTGSMFLIGASLNGWYATTTKKLSVNSNLFVNQIPFFSMTKYQGMLLFADDQYIWFSDTTLGGWIEQLEASASILVGDKEYGRITSICGTSDFLFVGRERKNYYVTGNIATGNYRVQEISEVESGPWCNNSSILVKDSVIFLTATGVYQLVSGGKVINLSERCPKQFETYTSNNTNEDVIFKMSGTSSNVGPASPTNLWSVRGLACSYDVFRQFLVFMKREENNASLLIHTGSGEIYEWDGLFSSYNDMYANCLRFIRTKYYLGQVDQDLVLKRAKYSVEDKDVVLNYPQTNPIKLYTSWMTGGEPSLEKELLQLKMFGRIDTTSSSGIKVRHYKDWNINTLITNTTYFPQNTSLALNDQVQYSHKKRLNSDKCLAASVGIEVDQADVTFELESFEVEFNPIQTGMKR
jgi:hypothetical protein